MSWSICKNFILNFLTFKILFFVSSSSSFLPPVISTCGLNITHMRMQFPSSIELQSPRVMFIWKITECSLPVSTRELNCHPEYLRGYSFQALHGPEYIGSLTSSKYLQKAHPQRLFLFEPIIQGSSRSINKWRPIRASRSKYNVR